MPLENLEVRNHPGEDICPKQPNAFYTLELHFSKPAQHMKDTPCSNHFVTLDTNMTDLSVL
jgi:hypothetical protein